MVKGVKGLKGEMYGRDISEKDALNEQMDERDERRIAEQMEESEEKVRIMVGVSGLILSHLNEESRRTGISVSALCATAIVKYIDDTRRLQGKK